LLEQVPPEGQLNSNDREPRANGLSDPPEPAVKRARSDAEDPGLK